MDSAVKNKFSSYPEEARNKLLAIRALLFDTAEHYEIKDLTETLKWGEPSYLSKKGSTIRIDWKAKHPDKVSLYFNCNTSLVETFTEIYGDRLCTVGKREIQLSIASDIPTAELRACISLALRYHSLKHLPLLGA